jgi:hypothetical protein
VDAPGGRPGRERGTLAALGARWFLLWGQLHTCTSPPSARELAFDWGEFRTEPHESRPLLMAVLLQESSPPPVDIVMSHWRRSAKEGVDLRGLATRTSLRWRWFMLRGADLVAAVLFFRNLAQQSSLRARDDVVPSS